MNTCLRIYTCGEAKLELRSDNQLEEWLAYNRIMRPENALFVNGKCLLKETTLTQVFDRQLQIHDRGYFALNHILWIEELLATNSALISNQPYGFFSTWHKDKLTREL